jgi:formylglycine-generating enzyme required for sulfatase activity
MWGLYDMAGNVREWCHDSHSSVSPMVTDPLGSEANYRALRGGSWENGPKDASASDYSTWGKIIGLHFTFGFRCGRMVTP